MINREVDWQNGGVTDCICIINGAVFRLNFASVPANLSD
jgi:hypothetical protein